MTMRQFILANRSELEAAVGRALGHVPRTASCYCPKSGTEHQHPAPKMKASEVRLWILNDESLYRWARSEGVRL